MRVSVAGSLLLAAILFFASDASAQTPATAPLAMPWMNTALTPDARATLVEHEMTQAEKLLLVKGYFGANLSFPWAKPVPAEIRPLLLETAGYVPGIARLGIPPLVESDAGLGVANSGPMRPGDEATAFPSGLSTAASWDPDAAFSVGTALGAEAYARGFNVVLDGALNLARDPRDGRTFEYAGEDPLLAGTMAGEEAHGIQSNHVVSTVKHYALNDQESGRFTLNANIDQTAARESDLLGFEIAIEHGSPGSVMCAYEKVNGTYSCENDFLLNTVLKHDWGYPGWVLSDWGGVHSTVAAANNGLDQESASGFDTAEYFGAPLGKAIATNAVTPARLDDMVHRILRSMFAIGLIDFPAKKLPAIPTNVPVAQHASEEGIVLLKNDGDILPLAPTIKRIAVIGKHSDIGMLSGGGSSQVIPLGYNKANDYMVGGAMILTPSGKEIPPQAKYVFDPPSPLNAIAQRLGSGGTVVFDDGEDIDHAAATAKNAEIAIVFVKQWMAEGADIPDLSLPGKQDALVAAVAAANPRTIVVLETGGPVLMPWLKSVPGLVEAWYAGNGGSAALARVLFGDVNPSGRLPITFPQSESQLPRPVVPGITQPFSSFDVAYTEGADVGYRWFEKQSLVPVFPFGFGLSYTKFSIKNLKLTGGDTITASVDASNDGQREGTEIVQIYAAPPAAGGHGVMRLVGWSRIDLKPGETQHLTIAAEPRLLASFDAKADDWDVAAGDYWVAAGESSTQLDATATIALKERKIKP